MSLGENIVSLRKTRGMSQTDLADELGVSRQSVSKWESDASTPELEKLLAMSELFCVSLDELVKGENATPALTERQAERGKLYCLVLTDSIFDKETTLRRLQEDFGYDEDEARKLIYSAPVVIKRGMRYRDAEKAELKMRETAWLKIMNDSDAADPIKVREGVDAVPPPADAREEEEGWSFGGTVVAVVLGVIIAVVILAWF